MESSYNKNIDINEINKYKKYLDVIYYKIYNEKINYTQIYNDNKEKCEEYMTSIYPKITILYMDIINNRKLIKKYHNVKIDIINKYNIIKYYFEIYSYNDQNSSL